MFAVISSYLQNFSMKSRFSSCSRAIESLKFCYWLVLFQWVEEYDLKYWLDRGFSMFVIANEASYIHGAVEPFRRLFGAIKDKCTLVEVLPTQRPLFWEPEYRVYLSKPLK